MIGWLVLALGCGTTPPEPPVAPHFTGFEQLASQIARGRLDTAGETARALTGDEDAAALGAALGMIQAAEDRDEALDALVVAAAVCRDCHRAQRATDPGLRVWTHHDAAGMLVDREIWGHPPPRDGDPQVTAALAAWTGPDPLGSALRTCGTCHAPE